MDSLAQDVHGLADTVLIYRAQAEQANKAATQAIQKAEQYRREVQHYKTLTNDIAKKIKGTIPGVVDSLWSNRINRPAN